MEGEKVEKLAGVYNNLALVIKIEGADSSIDSLNVSVAAGILMYNLAVKITQ